MVVVVVYRGENTIVVAFSSAYWYALAQAAAYPPQPDGIPPGCPPAVQQGFCHPNFIRKEPCSFSWDWYSSCSWALTGTQSLTVCLLIPPRPCHHTGDLRLHHKASGGTFSW